MTKTLFRYVTISTRSQESAPEGFSPTSKRFWNFATTNDSIPIKKDWPKEPDQFSNFPSVIIGFITSKIGLLLLAITKTTIGSIVLLVIVLNKKQMHRKDARARITKC